MEEPGPNINPNNVFLDLRSSILEPQSSIFGLPYYGGGAVGDTGDGAGAGSGIGSSLGPGLAPGPRNCSRAALICSGLGVPPAAGPVMCVSRAAQAISLGGFLEPTGRTAIPCSVKVRASRSPAISISRVMGRVNFCTADAPEAGECYQTVLPHPAQRIVGLRFTSAGSYQTAFAPGVKRKPTWR